MRRHTWIWVGLMWLGFVPAALASGFIVNTTADEVDVVPGDGVCLTANGFCSLRAAIQEANAHPGPDTIDVPAGTYTLTIPEVVPGPNHVDPEHGDLDVTDAVVIQGGGAGTTIIQAGTSIATAVGRVFDVALPGPVLVEIRDVTIRFGSAFVPGSFTDCIGGGGGVANRKDINNHAGAVKLADSVVTGNAAFQGSGGGLCNDSPEMLAILRTTVGGNDAAYQGGGIKSNAGQFFSIESTITGNHDLESGGGVAITGGQADFVSSTISGNTAQRGGGIVNNFATVTLWSTTVADNTATVNSGGVISAAGVTTIRHTVIARNQAPKFPDCLDLTSLGHNLVGINVDANALPCLAAPDPSDQFGDYLAPLDAGLGPLSYNGGPTQTHALLTGSLAIDAGDPVTGCQYQAQTLFTDQRGLPRSIAQCDIGGYEAQQMFGGAMATVMSSTGMGPVTFATSAGAFGSLDPVSEADLPEDGKPPVAFPYGLFSWTVTGLMPGQTITVTMTYPMAIPVQAAYWKVLGGVWTDVTSILGSNDGDAVLTLTITDGVFPDADGVVNGQISDPGGVSPPPHPAIVAFASLEASAHVDRRKVRLRFAFTLGAGSNGVDASREDATITIGDQTLTIPAGAYTLHDRRKGRFVLTATVTGLRLNGEHDALPVMLTIGDDSGNSTLRIKGGKTQ